MLLRVLLLNITLITTHTYATQDGSPPVESATTNVSQEPTPVVPAPRDPVTLSLIESHQKDFLEWGQVKSEIQCHFQKALAPDEAHLVYIVKKMRLEKELKIENSVAKIVHRDPVEIGAVEFVAVMDADGDLIAFKKKSLDCKTDCGCDQNFEIKEERYELYPVINNDNGVDITTGPMGITVVSLKIHGDKKYTVEKKTGKTKTLVLKKDASQPLSLRFLREYSFWGGSLHGEHHFSVKHNGQKWLLVKDPGSVYRLNEKGEATKKPITLPQSGHPLDGQVIDALVFEQYYERVTEEDDDDKEVFEEWESKGIVDISPISEAFIHREMELQESLLNPVKVEPVKEGTEAPPSETPPSDTPPGEKPPENPVEIPETTNPLELEF